MLSLKISGKDVDLPDDFSFTMNLKSPVFGDVGSYSYPFRIPATARNSILLGFRHRIESTTDLYREDNGVFSWNGLPLFQGIVKLKTLNTMAFEGSIFEGEGDFYYQRKNLSLQDVDYGDIMWFVNNTEKMAYINACKNTVYPQRAIAFPMVHNKTYFEEPPTEPMLEYFNYYWDSNLNSIKPGTNTRMVIVPMLYLRYVLKKIFEHLDFVFDDSFFSNDYDYNSLVLYNSVDCNSGLTGYFLYSDWSLVFNYHVPRMTMNEFFSGLESFFNLRFFVNTSSRIIKLISVDEIVKASDYIEFSDKVISVITEIEEQITGYHLKMGMETDDETYTAFKAELEVFLQRFKNPVQSLSDLMHWPLSDYFDLRWVFDENCYYTLAANNSWVEVSNTYFDDFMLSEFIYKKDDQPISTKFSTLMNESVAPQNAVVGSAMTDWKLASAKLFFSRYVDNGYYDRKMVGQHATASNSLFYGGDNGLLNKHYKAYFDFRMAAKFVKITKQMTFMELKDFDFSRKYMIGGIKYLVKTLQVTIKKDRVMPATLECYTCD